MPTMMQNPWFYVVMIAVVSIAIIAPLVVVRVLAAKERGPEHPDHDPHLR